MNAKAIIEKIDILWFENVEFAKVVLDWDEFFAGFSVEEKAVWSAAFPA